MSTSNPNALQARPQEIVAVVREEQTDRFSIRADYLISSAASWSAAAGAIPVPGVDLVTLGFIQMGLVSDLRAHYGQTIDDHDELRGLIALLIGTLVPMGATSLVAGSGSKFGLGFGTIFGMTSMAAFASSMTYAIGKVFKRYFENGVLLSELDAYDVKSEVQEEFTRTRNIKSSRDK